MTVTGQGGFGSPGIGAAVYTSEREILWGRDDQHLPLLMKNSQIDPAATDAGNSPTSILRRGLLLGQVTSTLLQKAWVATATDGTQNISSVLNVELRMTDFNNVTADRSFGTLLRAPVIASKLLIQGAAFVGHVDEYLARRQMDALGFVFDDDPAGFLAGRGYRMKTTTGTAETLTAASNGMKIFYSNAAAVAVTLPTIQAGLVYDLQRTADEELVVASAEGDNIIVGNDASADSITITTAGQQIGARVVLEGVYVGSTLKWQMSLPNMPFGTGLTGGFAYSIAT
jgi:hypothetical protein